MTYDKNGNIDSLKRNSLFSGAVATIDQLVYVYANGNQLTTVTDNSSYGIRLTITPTMVSVKWSTRLIRIHV